MLRLVEADFTSPGKTDLRDRPPSGFLHVRHSDTLRSERDDLGLQVVTHQEEFVPLSAFGGMDGHFCRRQRKDQPSVAGIHGGESEDLAAEGAIGLRIFAVENHVSTKDHERFLSGSHNLCAIIDSRQQHPRRSIARLGMRPGEPTMATRRKASRRIPKAPRLRSPALGRKDVTRAEHNRIIDTLNERKKILDALGDAINQLRHQNDVQFKRIAQLQAEVDRLLQALDRRKLFT
jgi:hypothetical protein